MQNLHQISYKQGFINIPFSSASLEYGFLYTPASFLLDKASLCCSCCLCCPGWRQTCSVLSRLGLEVYIIVPGNTHQWNLYFYLVIIFACNLLLWLLCVPTTHLISIERIKLFLLTARDFTTLKAIIKGWEGQKSHYPTRKHFSVFLSSL